MSLCNSLHLLQNSFYNEIKGTLTLLFIFSNLEKREFYVLLKNLWTTSISHGWLGLQDRAWIASIELAVDPSRQLLAVPMLFFSPWGAMQVAEGESRQQSYQALKWANRNSWTGKIFSVLPWWYVYFPREDYFLYFQCSLVSCSLLSRVEASWA